MRRHPIIIQSGAVKKFKFPTHSVVLCDEQLLPVVKKLFRIFPLIAIPAGESQKRLTTVEWICNQLVGLQADRHTSLIGVGGGVIGDLTGLVASLFMRGVHFYNVPTTLLAMVDSSIGGKNGVDLASGKNLVGTICQPQAVVMDVDFLKTLPANQFSNGMAEVVKHGVLDPQLFHWLEVNAAAIQQRHTAVLKKMIALSVAVKVAVVHQDEREHHERMLLNLGHTFGHAFELLSDYTLPHGQAVAIGLAYATAYAHTPERNRILALLNSFRLATNLSAPYQAKKIVHAMLADKKHHGDKITLVLPEQLGQIHIERNVTQAQLVKFLERYQA